MKKKILMTALIQFSLAGIVAISVVLLRSFESLDDLRLLARLYSVCGILGVTGICTGVIGAVYPKDQ